MTSGPGFAVGEPVEKSSGYPFPGVVVARFENTLGQVRYVVESTTLSPMLHIFSGHQLCRAERPGPPSSSA